MERFTITTELNDGYLDDFVTICYSEEEALEQLMIYSTAYGVPVARVLYIEQNDTLFDMEDFNTYEFDKRSRIYRMMEDMAGDFEFILHQDADVFEYVRECAISIGTLLDYTYALVCDDPERRYLKLTKQDLSRALKYVLMSCDAIRAYGISEEPIQHIVSIVNELYTRYAAKSVYNYG